MDAHRRTMKGDFMKIVVADKDSVGTDMDYSIYDELGEVTYYDDKITESKSFIYNT